MRTAFRRISIYCWLTGMFCCCLLSLHAQITPTGKDRIPGIISSLKPIRHLPDTTVIDLVIGLPLRNQEMIEKLLTDLYDSTSIRFHQFLSPDAYRYLFSPSEKDYQKLMEWAKVNALHIVSTQKDRQILHVRASASVIGKALQVSFNEYKHPIENRVFFAADKNPVMDPGIPISCISGLNNFYLPHRMESASVLKSSAGTVTGQDFRKAYAPGVVLRGEGQVVGILQSSGYFLSDIQRYETIAGFPDVPIRNIYLNGYDGVPDLVNDALANEESSLDIEMVISMAPGLSAVQVYGANYTNNNIYDLLHEMADPSHGEQLPMQLTSSYSFFYDQNVYDALDRFAIQGQSFFTSSGDFGAFNETTGAGDFAPADYPRVTCVGGTELSVSPTTGAWMSETAASFSGGGFSPWSADPKFAIPSWQQAGIGLSAIGGSTKTRNCPDVAMVADHISIIALGGQTMEASGTSASSPLWAGFMALVNQQASLNGRPTIGNLNAALYRIAKSADYAGCFHDITVGNNQSGNHPTGFQTFIGYDLVTGWGSPNGQHFIDALSTYWPGNEPLSTLKLVYAPHDHCDVGPVAGGTATFIAHLEGGVPPITYTWSMLNNITVAGGTSSSPFITVNVPGLGLFAPLGLSVTDGVGGILKANIKVQGLDPVLAANAERVCRLVEKMDRFKPPIFINPGDPGPVELRNQPYQMEDIQQMRKLLPQINAALKTLLRSNRIR